jgi:polyribonucleotide 5'-hydroxyl-kinase
MVSSGSTRRLTLPALNEYRFELDPLERLQITLISGHAELFGLELAPGQPYPFNNEVKAAIWSPTGAELEISGIFSIVLPVPRPRSG